MNAYTNCMETVETYILVGEFPLLLIFMNNSMEQSLLTFDTKFWESSSLDVSLSKIFWLSLPQVFLL